MEAPCQNPSRRDFLKTSGAVLTGFGALALGGTPEEIARANEPPVGTPIETAVIGGGISGLYAAWRLAERGDKVSLFEASTRLGGRLYTVPIPGTRIHAELGAMRFTEAHRLLHALVQHLKLPTWPFDFTETSFYYLRGRKYSGETLATQGPYYFDASAELKNVRKDPVELIYYTLLRSLENMTFQVCPSDPPRDRDRFHQEVNKIDRLRREIVSDIRAAHNDLAKIGNAWRKIDKNAWRFIKRYGYVEFIPLHDIGFWNLLEHYLGNEGFELVRDALGYESIVSNWNAAEAAPWFMADFSSDKGYLTIEGGFQVLVDKLSALLPGKGVEIHTEHRLQSLNRAPAGWQLEFDKGVSAKATRVILAVPRTPLERIKVTKDRKEYSCWQEIKRNDIPAVVARRLFKVLLVFEEAWWQKLESSWTGRKGRRVITDLPIRQIYYYSPEWIKIHNPPVAGSPPNWAVVMASYSDEHYASFWSPFAPPPSGDHHGICQLPKEHPLTEAQVNDLHHLARTLGVPQRMVEKLRSQLAVVHGVDVAKVPEPIIGIFRDWANEPDIGGGWHTWEVNKQGEDVSEHLAQPLKPEELYVCGEAYSSDQGWVEGALQSTERVLKLLKLAPPSWFRERDFDDYIKF